MAVLGPVEVHRDELRVGLPTGKTTEVLVRLALDAGRVVSVDRLIEDVWADAVNTGRNTLQSKVSQLRKALQDPELLRGGRGGYALDVDPTSVDALRAAGLAASAATARRTGDATTAVALAAEGLALFRGEVLVDVGDSDWLQAQRAQLEEVRMGLLEDLFAARVDLGAGGEVVGELEGLTERYPLREGLWSSLSPLSTGRDGRPRRWPPTRESERSGRRVRCRAGSDPPGARDPDPPAEPRAARIPNRQRGSGGPCEHAQQPAVALLAACGTCRRPRHPRAADPGPPPGDAGRAGRSR